MSKVERLEKQIEEMKRQKNSAMKDKMASPKQYLDHMAKYDKIIKDLETKVQSLRNK